MIVVGIDMSKNSPGVCVREDDKLTFFSFIRGSEDGGRMSKSRKRMIDHYAALRAAGVKITTNPRSATVKEYSELEVYKIMDASLLAETITSSLPDNVDLVAIEGFSYGSKGNAGLDIAGYAYCVRRSLYEKYGTKIAVFSPGAVKKTGGKGNAGKEEMMQYFLDSQDEVLRNSDFWKGIQNGTIDKTMKPCDDLVDSWWVCETAKRYMNR